MLVATYILQVPVGLLLMLASLCCSQSAKNFANSLDGPSYTDYGFNEVRIGSENLDVSVQGNSNQDEFSNTVYQICPKL